MVWRNYPNKSELSTASSLSSPLKSLLTLVSLSLFKEDLEPHERCIRKILEQKGRVVEIVYRLDSSDEIIEGFEAIDAVTDYIDEVGIDVAFDDESRLFEDGAPESALQQRVRSAWIGIQLGK